MTILEWQCFSFSFILFARKIIEIPPLGKKIIEIYFLELYFFGTWILSFASQ